MINRFRYLDSYQDHRLKVRLLVRLLVIVYYRPKQLNFLIFHSHTDCLTYQRDAPEVCRFDGWTENHLHWQFRGCYENIRGNTFGRISFYCQIDCQIDSVNPKKMLTNFYFAATENWIGGKWQLQVCQGAGRWCIQLPVRERLFGLSKRISQLKTCVWGEDRFCQENRFVSEHVQATSFADLSVAVDSKELGDAWLFTE